MTGFETLLWMSAAVVVMASGKAPPHVVEVANTWTQPLCQSCFVAFRLGAGWVDVAPVETQLTDPCLVCGEPTGIWVRVNPELTKGFRNAVKHNAD